MPVDPNLDSRALFLYTPTGPPQSRSRKPGKRRYKGRWTKIRGRERALFERDIRFCQRSEKKIMPWDPGWVDPVARIPVPWRQDVPLMFWLSSFQYKFFTCNSCSIGSTETPLQIWLRRLHVMFLRWFCLSDTKNPFLHESNASNSIHIEVEWGPRRGSLRCYNLLSW